MTWRRRSEWDMTHTASGPPILPPRPSPLTPVERNGFVTNGVDPDEWTALIVQVTADGIEFGQPPGANVLILRTASILPGATFVAQQRLVVLPEHVAPVTLGGVAVRLLVKHADVAEALRFPVCEAWEVAVVLSEAPTPEVQRMLDRYKDCVSVGEHTTWVLRTLTMYEAQELSAYFSRVPGVVSADVSPVTRSAATATPVQPSNLPTDERAAMLAALTAPVEAAEPGEQAAAQAAGGTGEPRMARAPVLADPSAAEAEALAQVQRTGAVD